MSREVRWVPPEMMKRGQHPYKPGAFLCCGGILIRVAMDSEFPAMQELRVHRRKCRSGELVNPQLVERWDWVQVRIDPRERSVSDAEVQRYRPTPYVETVRRAREARRRAE